MNVALENEKILRMQSVNPFQFKEDSMKRISVPILAVLAFLVASLFPFVDAVADDKTCMLKSDVGKVYVKVWDEDSGQDRQDKIFEGWLNSGELKKIQSSTGFIVFSYREAEDDRSYGKNHLISDKIRKKTSGSPPVPP